MADATTLTLGSVTFADFQIPDSIAWGGDQKTVIHDLVGDKRVIDVMGREDADLEWSGIFLGKTALDDARSLDAMRIGGQPQALAWDELSYSVIIKSFRPDYRKRNYIPYRIICEVISDRSQPAAGASDPTTDDMVGDDMDTCSGLVSDVGDSTLTGLFGTLQSAVSAVTSIASATTGQLASMLDPLGVVQGQVSNLQNAAMNVVTDLPGFAGVQVGIPGEQSAMALSASASAMISLDPLNQLSSFLGRIQTNLSAVGASGSEVPVAGGDLYALAASEYGDPSGWTTIAQANGLTDPVITGLQTIRVPPIEQSTDGVLSI